jgi:AcrR family transcriptional regulator
MVDAILQAAAAVFAELGYARSTTNKIADRAGVSVGSLYQYFPGKDSLIAALLEQHHAEVHDVVSAALARLADPAWTLEAAFRSLVTDLVALHRRDPALTRALSAAVLRESPAAEAKPHAGGDPAGAVAAVLASRPDVRSGNPVAMARVVGQATEHLTRWLVHDAPDGDDPDALAEEVVQVLVRYLRV